MEILVGIFVVFVLLIVIGKLKGTPDPKSMPTQQIQYRLGTESAWIRKYLSLPFENQQSSRLQRMYEEKKIYIQALEAEFSRRRIEDQIKLDAHVIETELQPTLEKISAAKASGASDGEAAASALKEWSAEINSITGHSVSPPKTVKNFFGEEVVLDTRTEEEKREAVRLNLERMARERDNEAREFVSESSIGEVASLLEKGEVPPQALTSVFKWRLSSRRRAELTDRIKAILQGGSSPHGAVKVALEEFSKQKE